MTLNRISRLPAALLVAVTLLAASAPEASAQQSSRWAPFLGCWDVLADDGLPTGERLCIEEGDTREAALWTTTFSDGETAQELVLADGTYRDVVDGACDGSTAASFSTDGRRIYLDGRFDCDGPDMQPTSGMLAMVSPDEWIDIRSIDVDGEPMAWTQRYSRTDTEDVGRGFDRSLADRVASATPSLATVIEVGTSVSSSVTVAWLSEVGIRDAANGSQLIALDDAGVPDPVIDAVVALSNPHRFAFGPGESGAADEFRPRVGSGYASCDRYAVGMRARMGSWGRFYRFSPIDYYGLYSAYNYGVGPRFGYGYNDCLSPYAYGYGYGYGYRGYYPTPIVVVPTTPGTPSAGRQGGRAVNGRGSVAPPRGDRSGSPPSATSGGRSGSGGSSGGVRRAKPRGGGGGSF